VKLIFNIKTFSGVNLKNFYRLFRNSHRTLEAGLDPLLKRILNCARLLAFQKNSAALRVIPAIQGLVPCYAIHFPNSISLKGAAVGFPSLDSWAPRK
jgi:hypothetical protein